MFPIPLFSRSVENDFKKICKKKTPCEAMPRAGFLLPLMNGNLPVAIHIDSTAFRDEDDLVFSRAERSGFDSVAGQPARCRDEYFFVSDIVDAKSDILGLGEMPIKIDGYLRLDIAGEIELIHQLALRINDDPRGPIDVFHPHSPTFRPVILQGVDDDRELLQIRLWRMDRRNRGRWELELLVC